MRSHKSFLICLLAATVVALANAAQPTWFPDWMNQDSSRARLASLGAETQYDSEERVRGCLRLVKAKGCACSGPIQPIADTADSWCSSQIQTLDMGCCRSQDSYYPSQQHADMLFSDMQSLSVGTCTWQVNYVQIGEPMVEVRPNVFVKGTASFTCELNAESDKCGSPLCDGLSLTGFSTVYQIDNTTGPVYTIGLVPPIEPPTDANGVAVENYCTPEPVDPRTLPGEFVHDGLNGPNTIGGPNDPNGPNGIGISDPNVPEAPPPAPDAPTDNIGIGNPDAPTAPTPPPTDNIGIGNPDAPTAPTPPPTAPTPPGEGDIPIGHTPGGGKGGGGKGGGGKGDGGKGFPIVIGPGKGGKGDGGKGNGGFPFRGGHPADGTTGGSNAPAETVVTGPPQQTVPVKAKVAAAAAAAKAATAAAAAKAAQYGREEGSGAALYYPAERLNVAVGSFFVTNSRQSIRYSSGRMQYVSVISQSSTAVPVSDPAPNALVFKPFTMDLLFDSRAADTF